MARNLVARLFNDGRLDPEFDPVAGPSGGLDPGVLTLDVGTDGNVMIGGDFTQVNGVARNRIARLNGNVVAPGPFRLAAVGFRPDGQFELRLKGEIGRQYQVYNSTNLTAWAPWTNFVASSTNVTLFDPGAMAWPRRFYRGTAR